MVSCAALAGCVLCCALLHVLLIRSSGPSLSRFLQGRPEQSSDVGRDEANTPQLKVPQVNAVIR